MKKENINNDYDVVNGVPVKRKSTLSIAVILIIILLISFTCLAFFGLYFYEYNKKYKEISDNKIVYYVSTPEGYNVIEDLKEYKKEHTSTVVVDKFRCVTDCKIFNITDDLFGVLDKSDLYIVGLSNLEFTKLRFEDSYDIIKYNLEISIYEYDNKLIYLATDEDDLISVKMGDINDTIVFENKPTDDYRLNLSVNKYTLDNNLVLCTVYEANEATSSLYDFDLNQDKYSISDNIKYNKLEINDNYMVMLSDDLDIIILNNDYERILDDIAIDYYLLSEVDSNIAVGINTSINGSLVSGEVNFYDSKGKLVDSSKKYNNILMLVDNYALIIDNNKKYALVDMAKDEIVATFTDYQKKSKLYLDISGKDTVNGKEGYYFVFDNTNVSITEVLINYPGVTKEELEEYTLGYKYYFIPSSGEVGTYATYIK